MDGIYSPEIGQAVFGQPTLRFEVPPIMDAVLSYLSHRLEIVMFNKHQETFPSPFSNTGNSFKCHTFEVESYSWGDEEQPFNFAWRDLRIAWYKYLGRGMSANMVITPDLANECLIDCLKALDELDAETLSEIGAG